MGYKNWWMDRHYTYCKAISHKGKDWCPCCWAQWWVWEGVLCESCYTAWRLSAVSKHMRKMAWI